MDRVLVVEDDPLFREMLCSMLEEEGVGVDYVATGEEALVKLGSASYRKIFLDMGLPGRISGYDILDRLQKVETRISVVVLSGEGLAMDKLIVGPPSKHALTFVQKGSVELPDVVRSALR